MSQADRVKTLRQTMKSRKLDAFFVSQPLNVYYLSDFRPMMWNIVQPMEDPEGFVLVEPDRVTFICDDRYDASPARATGAEHARIASPAGIKTLVDAIRPRLGSGARTVGYEAGSLLHADAVGLFEALPHVRWERADELLVEQRIRKDAAEQKLLKEAARVTDEAYAHALKTMRLGMTEHDLAEEINGYLRSHSDGCSFNSIVAFGETAAAPHYEPSHTRKLEKGHMVLMDFGANYKGYMGDMTRMAVMGKATDKQKQMYAWVLESQEACLKGLKPNMTGEAADKLSREAFEKHGVLDKYLHGTGHGVGLAIHEPPRLKVTFQNKLSPGSVFTVEPGLYELGWGGIRIEDVVIMHDSGPENITHAPKDRLIEVAC